MAPTCKVQDDGGSGLRAEDMCSGVMLTNYCAGRLIAGSTPSAEMAATAHMHGLALAWHSRHHCSCTRQAKHPHIALPHLQEMCLIYNVIDKTHTLTQLTQPQGVCHLPNCMCGQLLLKLQACTAHQPAAAAAELF